MMIEINVHTSRNLVGWYNANLISIRTSEGKGMLISAWLVWYELPWLVGRPEYDSHNSAIESEPLLSSLIGIQLRSTNN